MANRASSPAAGRGALIGLDSDGVGAVGNENVLDPERRTVPEPVDVVVPFGP
jgi:hypothetical protein